MARDALTQSILRLEDQTFECALAALLRHDRRQRRLEHPEGMFDRAGRWYPSQAEDHGVSARVRSPSAAFPRSYMAACRTIAHCEAIEGASHEAVLLLRRWLLRLELGAERAEVVREHRQALQLAQAMERKMATRRPAMKRTRL